MFKTIDLFAGAGGLSLGFRSTGQFELVAAAEINKSARETYRKNLVTDPEHFEFIENVIGYDFAALNQKFNNEIDVVIGGPPCQGFSNANRQKNHLISLNNGLVKEYFRAIKEIKPKAFVMENVSMLSSEKHRFYESRRDNKEIQALKEAGYEIPEREDKLIISEMKFEGIDLLEIPDLNFDDIALSDDLAHLLSTLKKNLGNSRRLPNFLKKHSTRICNLIETYTGNDHSTGVGKLITDKLVNICKALRQNQLSEAVGDISYVVGFQKAVTSIKEISDNGLIGEYGLTDDGALVFSVNSYSVIDYVNAILGGQYIQQGAVMHAEWFGVPQERRRFIVIGIRKDIYEDKGLELEMPKEPEGNYHINTVKDAIGDLINYKAGYTPDYEALPYGVEDEISDYARKMRKDSTSVKNLITTSTRETAMSRFKKIKPGDNFHSLSPEDKDNYSDPSRTQNTIYLRLDPDKPSGTVLNVRKSMWIHPLLDRAITVREAARLQSFPDTFEFTGTKDSQYQQVGNAVPPLLARAVAETILKYI